MRSSCSVYLTECQAGGKCEEVDRTPPMIKRRREKGRYRGLKTNIFSFWGRTGSKREGRRIQHSYWGERGTEKKF